jgi:hypothetical protein
MKLSHRTIPESWIHRQGRARAAQGAASAGADLIPVPRTTAILLKTAGASASLALALEDPLFGLQGR